VCCSKSVIAVVVVVCVFAVQLSSILFRGLFLGGIYPMFAAGSRQQIAT